LSKVKQAVKIPVVGNGSMFTPQDVKNMIDQTGCDSAMIARGALGNPFIFSRFNKLIETGVDPGEPDVFTVRDTLLQHISNLENEFGELLALDKAKKHTIWYFRYNHGMNSLLNSVFSIKSLDLLRSLINEHSQKIADGSVDDNEGLQIDEKFQKKVLFWLEDDIQELG
jgi:tRNA-dihydrouridine synthase